MAETAEQIAERLARDPEFQDLSEDRQSLLFQDLVKDLQKPQASSPPPAPPSDKAFGLETVTGISAPKPFDVTEFFPLTTQSAKKKMTGQKRGITDAFAPVLDVLSATAAPFSAARKTMQEVSEGQGFRPVQNIRRALEGSINVGDTGEEQLFNLVGETALAGGASLASSAAKAELAYRAAVQKLSPTLVQAFKMAGRNPKLLQVAGPVSDLVESKALIQSVERLGQEVPEKVLKGRKPIVEGTQKLRTAQEIAMQKPVITIQDAEDIVVSNAVKRGTRIETLKKGFQELGEEITTSSDTALRSMGNAGRQYADTFQAIRTSGEVQGGNAIQNYLGVAKNLTPAQKKTLVDMAEGRVLVAEDPAVRQAFDVYKDLRKSIQSEFSAVGGTTKTRAGDIVAFTGRQHYFPHQVPSTEVLSKGPIRKEILEAAVVRGEFKSLKEAENVLDSYLRYAKSPSQNEKVLQWMVDTKKAKTLADAEYKLKKYISTRSSPRYGALERSREVDLPFWDPDPSRVLPRYFENAWARIEEVRRLGPRNELALSFEDAIREEGGNAILARKIRENIQGLGPKVSENAQKALDGMRSYEAITKLGLSQIVNAPQGFVNSSIKAGVRTTTQALHDILRSPELAEDFAVRSGALLDSTIREVTSQMGPDAAGEFLRKTGFSATERFNRILSSNTAKQWIPDLIDQLKINPGNPIVRRELAKLGLDPEVLLKGKLTNTMLQEGANRFVNSTQFRASQLDLPLFWSSPWGKLMTQFKSFSFNHAKFIRDEVLREAKAGNVAPLVRFLAIGGITGEVVADASSALRARPRPENLAFRILDNLSYVGGIGLVSDMFRSALSGSGMLAEAVAGPALSDVFDYASALAQLTQGEAKPTAKKVLRSVPILGPIVQPRVLPGKKKKKSRLGKVDFSMESK